MSSETIISLEPPSPAAKQGSVPKERGQKRSGAKSNRPQYQKNNHGGKPKAKRAKHETGKDDTRRRREGFDVNRDDRNLPANPGSYANGDQRRILGVENIDENRIKYTEDAKIVKRKVALLLAYIGKDYCGFQVNPSQRTLQGEIELALYRSGMLSEINFGNPFKYGWSNSARTDKGVHACAQVCSLKVELLESDIDDSLKDARQRLQERLPPDIQVLDMMRTTRNFCAKTQRDRARYQYMIPSFLFHPDYRQLLVDNGIPLTGRRDTARTPLLPEEIEKLRKVVLSYRSTDEQRRLLQEALKKYEGTNTFHNFTKGLRPGEPQAQRFIESFTVNDPVVMHGMEWVPTQVLGQSFLLHQIRKMISMAVDVTRGAISLGVMDRALAKEEVVIVSLAPAQGLFLELSYFDGYNRHKRSQNPELPDVDFQGKEGKDRWEAFRNKIREHIADEEIEQGNFLHYLYQQDCLFDYRHTQTEAGDTRDADEDETNQD
jgi:tRNA pseudouridine38-40 synthase